MIEIDKLPEVIGLWKKTRPGGTLYRNGDRGAGIEIKSEGSYIHFGIIKPCGASIKRVSVETNEDIIKCLTSVRTAKEAHDYNSNNK